MRLLLRYFISDSRHDATLLSKIVLNNMILLSHGSNKKGLVSGLLELSKDVTSLMAALLRWKIANNSLPL